MKHPWSARSFVHLLSLSLVFLPWLAVSAKPIRDEPFLQDVSVKIRTAASLTNAEMRRLEIDRDGVVYVLTDRGVARLFEDTLTLAPDRSFRPLAELRVKDIALGQGALYYLFEDRWLSNGDSGRPLGHLPTGRFKQLVVAEDASVLVAGDGAPLVWPGASRGHAPPASPRWAGASADQWFAHDNEFFARLGDQVLRLTQGEMKEIHRGKDLTTLAFRGEEVLIGTRHGYYGIDRRTGAPKTPLQDKLPVLHIQCLWPTPEGIWAGTPRGVFFQSSGGRQVRLPGTDAGAAGPLLPAGPHGIRYYASKRWLADDDVVDLKPDASGNLLVLTKSGLNRIEFRPWTLSAKAAWYDRKIRQRHVRFGLAGERRLPVAGAVESSEIIDTDNDGGWSSYYLGSQAFRFAATRSEEARSNAWEVFAALERLREITQRDGFFARTIERKGFKYSDTDRWRDAPDPDWEWKGHTSSDEFSSHTFAHAVMWELVAASDAQRNRIATNYTTILDHILRHNLYLIDVDGKPTLWGRWNPEYVNWYPPSIGDRRLNSAEIISGLQLAHRMTGQERYRAKAYELFERHGYLTNILNSMKGIKFTPGYVHQGNNMGDEWNHSDDELAFVIYWVLQRFAFTRDLRARFTAAIRDHWEIEKAEQFPIWNFIYSACGGGSQCDAAGAVWTLRGWPLDTITWRIQNSHRQDLTKLPKNFYGRELEELLPPGERQIARINTQPFILDGGDGGHIELPGDEFLFGYWLGRLLGLVGEGPR